MSSGDTVKLLRSAPYFPVVQEAYHVEEFAIRDLDGHVLGFGQSI